MAPVMTGSAAIVRARSISRTDALYAVLCLISVVPLLAFEHPRIVDFANHWARLHIECSADDLVLTSMYQVRLAVIPNLGIDIVNLALCDTASPRAILLGALVTAHLGILLVLYGLHRSLWDRTYPTLALAPLLMFNATSTMGYINYVLGLFVALALVYALVAWRNLRLHWYLLLCNVAGTLIFFCHIFALAFAGVCIFARNFATTRADQKLHARLFAAGGLTAAGFAVPGVLLLFVPGSDAQLAIHYFAKVRAIMAPVQTLSLLPDLLIACVLACLGYHLWKSKMAIMAGELRLPLLALAAAALIVPPSIYEAIDIDGRFVVGGALLAVAGLGLVRSDIKLEGFVVATAVVLLALRIGTLSFEGIRFDRQVAEFRQSLHVIPAGARVLSARGDEEMGVCGSALTMPEPYFHLASFATIDRRAFNPLEFTGRGMQPMQSRPPYSEIDVGASEPIMASMLKLTRTLKKSAEVERVFKAENVPTYYLNWQESFEFVIYYHFGCPVPLSADGLKEVGGGSFFTIFAIANARNPPG